MRIKRFNESHTKDEMDFEDIFYDIIDYGFNLKISKGFLSEDLDLFSIDTSITHQKTGYKVELKGPYFPDINQIYEIVGELIDAESRLSDTGDVKRLNTSFSRTGSVIVFLIVDSMSSGPEEKSEDFYRFTEAFKRVYRNAYNKVTRGFELKQTNYGIELTPKEGITAKSLFGSTKTFINNKFKNSPRSRWRYDYDIKLIDNRIEIHYKGTLNL